jgi:hypothetical protein
VEAWDNAPRNLPQKLSGSQETFGNPSKSPTMTGRQRWVQLPDAGLVERARHPVDRAEREAALREIFRRYRDVVATVCVFNLDDLDRVQRTFEVGTEELIRGEKPHGSPKS